LGYILKKSIPILLIRLSLENYLTARFAVPIWQELTFVANRNEHKLSWKFLKMGEILTNISVLLLPPGGYYIFIAYPKNFAINKSIWNFDKGHVHPY
jgi:hypothetical protein